MSEKTLLKAIKSYVWEMKCPNCGTLIQNTTNIPIGTDSKLITLFSCPNCNEKIQKELSLVLEVAKVNEI